MWMIITFYFHIQFGFKEGHSNDHALVELINSTYGSFNQNKYALSVFIDLSNVSDTVDHNLHFKKQVYTVV